MKHLRMILTLLVLSATLAWAGSGWHKIGTFTAGGDAKEMTVNRRCSTCLIKAIEGSVSVHTIVVRQGDRTTPIKVTARLDAGSDTQVGLGDKISVTSFRVSDGGQGRYEIYVK